MLHLSFMKYDDTIGTTAIGHEISTRVFESSLLNNFYNNAVLNIIVHPHWPKKNFTNCKQLLSEANQSSWIHPEFLLFKVALLISVKC